MIDKYRLQLQLLPRIEGYNLILKEPVNINFTENKDQTNEIAFLHYLFCQENLTSDSTFNQIAGDCNEIDSDEIIKQLDKLYEKIPTDKESLTNFVNKNLSEINLWHAYSVLKKEEELTNSFSSYLHTLQDKVMKVVKENIDIQVSSTPSKTLNQIKLLVATIIENLNQYAESHEQVHGILKEFMNLLDNFQNIVSNAVINNDFILFSLSESEFLKYRNQISDFSFFCGYLDKGNDFQFSKSFSELLFLIDSILSFHNSLPVEPVNPLAVSKAADSCFQWINSIISQEDSSVSVYREHLIALSGIFEDISIAFRDLVCLKPIVTRLVPFLIAIQKNIEPIIEQFTMIGYNIEIHNFLISFYQVIDLLKKLEFDSSMVSHVNTNVILNDNVDVSEQIIKTKELIESSSSNHMTEYEISELILLFVNPSKDTKSTEGSARGSKPEKVTESIEEVQTQLTQLCSTSTSDLTNNRTIQSFAKLSKKLLVIGKSVDALKSSNPEINDQYVEVIQSLNASIYNLIDINCQPIDTMTSFSCVRSICSLLDHSLKMLDSAESTDVDPKDDRKTIKSAIKFFEDLSQNFNEPLLIENAPEIEGYQKDLTKIYEENATKYDTAARECYISNLLEYVLTMISMITLLIGQMEEKAYELSEAFEDVDVACSSLLKSLEVLTLEDQVSTSPLSIPVQHIIKLLSQQLEKVNMIRYTLAVAIPQQLVRPIIEYRASIDYLPSIVFPFDFDHDSIKTDSVARLVITALNSLSLARWKLGHLKEYYLYDQELKAILKDVSDELKNAQSIAEKDDKLDQTAVENFKADNKNMLQTVDNIYSILGIFNERTGDEPTDYIDIFKTLIHQVTDTWNKDLSKNNGITTSMENARKRLNDAIELLHGDAVKYQVFVNPLEQFGDSYLVPYLAASATRYGGDDFYKTAMDAKYIDFPAGNDKLKKGMEIMNSFINIITISPDEVQKMIAAPMIYYVAAAKLMAYRQYKEFLDLAIAFMEARPHELNNICFLLSYHMHKIYEKCAPNTIKSKDSIADMLRVLYMQHANSKLADTYYYTTVFSTLIPKEHAPIFTVLAAPMRECFHCRIQLSNVNFKEAIAYLNGIYPTPGRLAELKSIVDSQPKLEAEVSAVVGASKRSAEGKGKDDDEDVDLHAQEVVVSRNVQVLQPKRLTSLKIITYNKLLSPNVVQARVIRQSPSTISSILDENIDNEMDNHNGRIYEPLRTEITIKDTNPLSPKTWQTLIVSKFANEAENDSKFNRESHYKKSWYTKPCAKNNIDYSYNDIDVPEFRLTKLIVQNEYNLPEEDKEAGECTIKTILSSELMRKISYSIDEREFNVSPLGEIFENQFVLKKINKFPDEKEYVAPETVPAALKKLKKAKAGDFVSLIKQDKSTHEELLNSLVFGVSRFLDIISAANVESLCGFISIFGKEELEENLLPWIYHQFSPKHYPKHFFTLFLTSVATYMRTVFLERAENNEMVSALIAYPYLIHIATASALVRAAKKPDLRVFSKDKQASAIHEFVNATSYVISCCSNYMISKQINHQLALFMVAIAPYCDEFAFMTTCDSYFRNLTNIDEVELIGNLAISNVPAGVMNFKCQLTLLRHFAPQKEFVQALARYNEQIFVSVFKNSTHAFQNNDSKSITKFFRSMSEISIIAESVEGQLNEDKVNENAALIASQIIPYIDIAIHNYNNEVIQNDASLVEHLLIPLILVLHSATRAKVINHFYELSSEDKSLFFSCVSASNLCLVTKSGSPNPFEDLPNFITREEHLDYLEDKSINTQYVNYTLFGEFTIRLVEFVCRYIREHPLPEEVLDDATVCINSLFNRHQLRDNYEHCLYLLVYFVTVHSNLFFTGDNNLNAFRSIVINAYKLVSNELQIARSSGVTILVHLMYCDFMYTNHVIISGYYIMETHIKCALEKNLINRRNQLLLYTNLIIQIDLYANNFSLKKFVVNAGKLIERLKILHKYIKEKLFSKQSQQSVYTAVMKLADQFADIPTLRLFWLEEMHKYNLEKKLLAQAYQSQVRVVSLISSVLKGLGKYDDVPYSVDNLFAENFYYKADDKVNIEYETFPGQNKRPRKLKPKSTQSPLLPTTQEEEQTTTTGTATMTSAAGDENSTHSSNKELQGEEQTTTTTMTSAAGDENSTHSSNKAQVSNDNETDVVDMDDDSQEDENENENDVKKPPEEHDLKMIYYNSPKFTEEYLRKSIFEALHVSFDATLVRQYSQINSLFNLQVAESGETPRVFEDIKRPLYFYLFGERAKGKTVSMRIYSTTVPNVEDFVKGLLDEKSPLCALKTSKFRINVFDSIVEAENKVNGGRFVIPVDSEKVVTFRGESSLFISDYIEPSSGAEDEDNWSIVCVKRTFFKTSHPLPSDSIFVNAKKHIVRTITRKALFSSRVKFAADFLAISRSATRNFKRSVSISPLVYSLGATLIDENCIGSELIEEYKSRVKDADFNLLAKSFIQDVSETMLLFIDRVRPMINPQPAIEAYRKIYDAATKTAKNLRITDYEFTEL